MNSITTFFALFFVLFASTTVFGCIPVRCKIICQYGFENDAEGCPHCVCRETPSVCLESIADYTCGGFNYQDCPSSHECHIGSDALTGQCCLKSSVSTTSATSTQGHNIVARSVASGTSTARTITGASRVSTRRMFKRSATASTTQSSATGGQSTDPSTTARY